MKFIVLRMSLVLSENWLTLVLVRKFPRKKVGQLRYNPFTSRKLLVLMQKSITFSLGRQPSGQRLCFKKIILSGELGVATGVLIVILVILATFLKASSFQ